MDREKELFEWIRGMYLEMRPEDKKDAERFFPELVESEDERIRKWLIELIKSTDANHSNMKLSENCKLALAYLERQKEQKPVKLNDDTEVGLDRALQIVKDAKGNLGGYQSDDGIYECDHAIQTLERILKNGIEQKPAEWSLTDATFIEEIDETLFMAETGRNEVVKNQIEKERNWLKSLRPHPHWKPNKEQMVYLKEAIKKFDFCDAENAGLQALYEQLKKLC